MGEIIAGRSSRFSRRRTSPFLMFFVIALIIVSPVTDTHPRLAGLVALLIVGSVLAGASVAGNRQFVLRVTLPLVAVWFVIRVVEDLEGNQYPWDYLAHGAGLLVSCTLLWALFNWLRDTREVTSSVIAECAIEYLVIAIAFSQAYWILNETLPHGFNQEFASNDNTAFLYFSLVTLTSVGYGDIIPANPYIRLISALESMTGIFYIAVVVSRLVSSYQMKPVQLVERVSVAESVTQPEPEAARAAETAG